MFDLRTIENQLKKYVPYQIEATKLRTSAVLLPLVPTTALSSKNLSYQILMTERSPKLNHHRGEMSFPGGKFDESKDLNLEATALRETYEEIGVPAQNIRIIGMLDDLPTLTGWTIRVFVGILSVQDDFQFKINEDEVVDLVKIPIEYISQENLFTKIPFPRDNHFSMLSFDYFDPVSQKKYNIWGASAHILQEFLKKLYSIIVIRPEYQRPTLKECLDALNQ
jgi:8-oxo-dGTP pyrophosphatase MutT (NUDIX family)